MKILDTFFNPSESHGAEKLKGDPKLDEAGSPGVRWATYNLFEKARSRVTFKGRVVGEIRQGQRINAITRDTFDGTYPQVTDADAPIKDDGAFAIKVTWGRTYTLETLDGRTSPPIKALSSRNGIIVQ